MKLRRTIHGWGQFLSSMVMPNISAFIAWGLITALFIEDGWWPNERIASLVSPMIYFLLPLLIGTTGGRLVHGQRGAVMGAVGTIGLIVGADIPMFLGAMLIGPLGAYGLKLVDKLLEKRLPMGFEMLIGNISAGLMAMGLGIVSLLFISPFFSWVNSGLARGVAFLLDYHILPFSGILIESGKVLFMNNAINHGLLGPLGLQDIATSGKSIFFLLETNPGPGLGILLGYWFFGKGTGRQSAPGAMVIHFLGGIHEIYFPYLLMKPILILAAIGGSMTGITIFQLLDAGLVGIPSPGSIFTILTLTPKTGYGPVVLGILGSTLVSFFMTFLFMRRESDDPEMAKADTPKVFLPSSLRVVHKPVVVCDAGMGSSAMASSLLERRCEKQGMTIPIENYPVNRVPEDADFIVCHEGMKGQLKKYHDKALMITMRDFLQQEAYQDIAALLIKYYKPKEEVKVRKKPKSILLKENIILHQEQESKEEAINRVGRLLVDSGYVTEAYIEGMHNREKSFSTYIGNHVAIPHGENGVKEHIQASGIVVVQYPEGVDFGSGNIAYLVIGIAGLGNEHLMILANIADAIEEAETVELLRTTRDKKLIMKKFS